jgi:hypothetical protein
MRLERLCTLKSLYFFGWVISRALLVLFTAKVEPELFRKLYGPYLREFTQNPSFDPWSRWASISNDLDAFPYGWPMLLILSAGFILGSVFATPWIGFLLTLLVFDLLTFLALIKLSNSSNLSLSFVALSYIAAPSILVSVFALGSTDLIPMAFLIIGIYAIDRDRPALAGLLFGVAIGSKIILIVIIVGLVLFYSRLPKLKVGLKPFLVSLGLALVTSSTQLFLLQRILGFFECFG